MYDGFSGMTPGSSSEGVAHKHHKNLQKFIEMPKLASSNRLKFN